MRKDFGDRAAILTDVTRCVGCETCVAACKKRNGLGKDQPRRWKAEIDDLSSTRFTTIVHQPGPRYVRKQCRHCNEPACVSACIVGALKKTDDGAVVYARERCMGCRYCLVACPFNIPRYNWEERVPYLHKCTLCFDSRNDGEEPACTAACPYGATIFGTRDELLAEARKRLADRPDIYAVQRIYGEKDVGGTSVLYISDVPLDFLAWNDDLPQRPLGDRTHAALATVPWTAGGVGAVISGVWWVIERRMKMQALAAKAETDEGERE